VPDGRNVLEGVSESLASALDELGEVHRTFGMSSEFRFRAYEAGRHVVLSSGFMCLQSKGKMRCKNVQAL
jgi:hypothetical protein